MSKRRRRPTGSAKSPTALPGHTAQNSSVSAPAGRTRTKRRYVWLAVVLLALLPAWWAMRAMASKADRQLLQQGVAELDRDPHLAEEILELVQSDDEPDVLAALTEARARQQRWPDAEEAAKKWTTVAPSSVAAWQALAEIERQQQKIVPCRSALEKALSIADSTADQDALHAHLFQLSLLTDDAAAARRHIDQIRDERTGQAERDTLAYAQLLRLEGQLDQARALAAAHVADDNASTAALMLRGIIALDAGDFEGARSDLAKVIAIDPNNKEAHYKLGVALRGLGRLDEARHHFQINQQLTSQSDTAER